MLAWHRLGSGPIGNDDRYYGRKVQYGGPLRELGGPIKDLGGPWFKGHKKELEGPQEDSTSWNSILFEAF